MGPAENAPVSSAGVAGQLLALDCGPETTEKCVWIDGKFSAAREGEGSVGYSRGEAQERDRGGERPDGKTQNEKNRAKDRGWSSGQQ